MKTFRGTLHADGYAGFGQLFVSQEITESACWAHARRKLYEVHQALASPLAATALTHISALYAIEAEIRGRPPDQRRAVRQARAAPLLGALREWLEHSLEQVSRKSGLAEAVRYALGRWPALTRYCDDGRLEIDNNAAERALRPVALRAQELPLCRLGPGRRSCGCDVHAAGHGEAQWSRPEAYLRHVLARIAEHPINRIDALLPWNVVEQLVEPERIAA
ncbi:MAG: IS66 family transposase [Gammaproteobacteria bacterium]|nr:IS66 family transposase [Gammaproteobacteria bacterium]